MERIFCFIDLKGSTAIAEQLDFLISQDLLERVDELGPVTAAFVDETIPRGKEEKVRLYSLENPGDL